MYSQKKYLLVVNPISGGLDKTEMVDAVMAYAIDSGIEIETYETTGIDDKEKIKMLFAKVIPERVIIIGGDGTIKMVAEALENKDVVFGIIPAGSANGLTVDLNFPSTLEENVSIAFTNDYIQIDMVSINDKKSLHLSDIGLNAELIKNYESSFIRGKLGYLLQTIRTIIDESLPFKVKISANTKIVNTIAEMIVIANSKKYGTGVTINPFGVMNDGKFEIIILKNIDIILFWKIITGNIPLNSEDVEIIYTDKAKLSTNVPVHFQIDGEYYGQVTELDINILHKQLKVAVPKIT